MVKRTSFYLLLAVVLVGCGLFSKDYSNTFDDNASWAVRGGDGVSAEIIEERLIFESILPSTVSWSTAGRSDLENGTYSLDTGAISGSPEIASGLLIRADPSAGSFYYFMVSADGAYSIGGCYNNCESIDDFIALTAPAWISTEDVNAGFDANNSLKIEARGSELDFFLNGDNIESFSTSELPKGDIGIIVRTFDSGASVAFDNLLFVPFEEESAE